MTNKDEQLANLLQLTNDKKRLTTGKSFSPGRTSLASPSPTQRREVPDRSLLFNASQGPDSYSVKSRPVQIIFLKDSLFAHKKDQVQTDTLIIVSPVRHKVAECKRESIVVCRLP